MAYKLINLVKNKLILNTILCLVITVGTFSIWRYKMNYEMIMHYTDLNENAPDFPFGQKKIDARYWILEKNFSKIDDYKIYNSHINHLEKNSKLESAIIKCIEDDKVVYPIIYKKFKEKKILSNFENELVTIYLFSVFDENTNMPNQDFFLIYFDRYEASISRRIQNKQLSYSCSDISIKGKFNELNPVLIKKIKSINPRFPEYLNK
ncbi:hypothetical protein QR665_13485 [Acinetobacter gerneri]|uniref:hypothetical protein n=1 Tax=Acinetobacter gerneri TaxID=202952 RepID=UPI002936A415|nr:hypothetical protein [Acinetobacter gerneri]MDV2440478.1 hypothetical protein [Acinetobacter gerneri]